MRIRKNAKISQLSSISTLPSSTSNPLQLPKTHHLQCQLNQSPWDVITFPIPPQEDSSSPHFQVEEDLGFAGSGSSGDSIGAILSSGSMKLPCTESEKRLSNDVKLDFCEIDNRYEGETQVGFNKEEQEEIVEEEEDVVLCPATDGKGWQCGRVGKKWHRMCGWHWKKDIDMMGDKGSGINSTTRAAPRRGRPRIKKKEAALANNPCGSGIFEEDGEIGFIECDDHEDDYDHDIEGEEKSGKKRGRKRIKERSLKSLM